MGRRENNIKRNSLVNDLKGVISVIKDVKNTTEDSKLIDIHQDMFGREYVTTENGLGGVKEVILDKLNNIQDNIMGELTKESSVDKTKLNNYINKLRQATVKSIDGFFKEYSYKAISKEDMKKIVLPFNTSDIKVNDLLNNEEVDFDIIRISYGKLNITDDKELDELRRYINSSIMLNLILDFGEENNEEFGLFVAHKVAFDTKGKFLYYDSSIGI